MQYSIKGFSKFFYVQVEVISGFRAAHFEKSGLQRDFPGFDKYFELVGNGKAGVIGQGVVTADNQFAVFNGVVVIVDLIADVNNSAFQGYTAVFRLVLYFKQNIGGHEEVLDT